MGTRPEEHAGRSAELQRLLNEAAGQPTPRVQRPERPAPPTTRSPLRSSPSTAFPRRVGPVAPRADIADSGSAQPARPNGDPAARLRRTALVRSPVGSAGVRRLRKDPNGDPVGQAGRLRTAAGAGGRSPGPTVSPSTKTAAARSFAGRWGPAGFSPVGSGQRSGVDPFHVPSDAGRRQPVYPVQPVPAAQPVPSPRLPSVSQASAAAGAAATGPATRSRSVQAGTGPGARTPTALPPAGRPRQRRTLVLAGGVAAAVVAIVAIVSLGNRTGSAPRTDADSKPAKVAMVQSTGADGRPTMTTVTAPVSTVNGRVVALVPDAKGQVQQLPVVTATPRTVAPRTSGTTAPPSSSRPADGGAVPSSTSSSPTPSPSSTSAPTTRSASPAPADPGEVATVVTGLTTLTGWVPVTTG